MVLQSNSIGNVAFTTLAATYNIEYTAVTNYVLYTFYCYLHVLGMVYGILGLSQ